MQQNRTSTAPFIRMDNQMIRRRTQGIERPDDVGLFALLSAFLSIPGFRTPGGGMHRLVAAHCSNGRHSISAAWQRLSRSGYLKRTRLPDGSFRLHDLYSLLSAPDTAQPAIRYASLSQGRRLLEQHRSFEPPTDNYTAVSYAMLMDARLSLAAKGVYALIRQKLQLAEHVSGIIIHKEALRRSSGMGECAFRRVWRELRDTGYLTLRHEWDPARRCMGYRYLLAEQVALPDEATSHLAPESLPEIDTQQSEVTAPTLTSPDANEPILRASRATLTDVADTIREQIEYDVLRERGNPQALLDLTVDLMTQISLYPPGKTLTIKGAAYSAAMVQRTLSSLDANEVEFAIGAAAAAAAKQQIRSMRAYLLCCLLSAKVDFAMSVTLF